MLALVALLAFASLDTQPSAGDSVVRGEVTDSSGAVLPGVAVVATAADGRVVGQTFTDDVGRYQLRSLPSGLVKLSFALDGFESGFVSVLLRAGDDSRVVERLRLAKVTEAVVVYGKLPAPPAPVVFEREPAPTVVAVPQDELESLCRPAKPGSTIGPLGSILSNRGGDGRVLYSKGDQVFINGGLQHGLEVGRNLIVIRYFRADRSAEKDGTPQFGEHTAGLVQIVDASADTARGVVVHTCNELRQGDLLAPFLPVRLKIPAGSGVPGYDAAARILFADSGQLLGAPGRFMVIDQGAEHGIYAGQRITLFRRRTQTPAPAILGEAVVVAVKGKSSTIRIERAIDAITSGDLAAPQR